MSEDVFASLFLLAAAEGLKVFSHERRPYIAMKPLPNLGSELVYTVYKNRVVRYRRGEFFYRDTDEPLLLDKESSWMVWDQLPEGHTV